MAFMRAYISNEPETWLITEMGDSEVRTLLPDGDYYTLEEDDLKQIARKFGEQDVYVDDGKLYVYP